MTYEQLKILFEDHFKISRPADIARTLGVSPQAVSNWKSRNQVPYKYAMILKEKLDESVKNYQDTTISNFNNKANQTQKSSNYNFEHSNMYGNDIISHINNNEMVENISEKPIDNNTKINNVTKLLINQL